MTSTIIHFGASPGKLQKLEKGESSRVIVRWRSRQHSPVAGAGAQFLLRYAELYFRTGGRMRGYPLESAVDWLADNCFISRREARRVISALIEKAWLELQEDYR